MDNIAKEDSVNEAPEGESAHDATQAPGGGVSLLSSKDMDLLVNENSYLKEMISSDPALHHKEFGANHPLLLLPGYSVQGDFHRSNKITKKHFWQCR